MSEEELTNGPGTDAQPELLEVEAQPAEVPAAEPDRALLEAQQQASDNWERFVRAQAEMENLRRRVEKDLQNAHKYALEKFARELLPVMDSLELGIAASTADTPDVAKLREGAELTLKQFQSVFEKFGILAVDPVGEKFNPEQHQAMAMESAEAVEPNTVLKVFQKGYLLNDRLLRPALVVVAQA
ncbi:nucleotide exchange factor GrpE [Methylococcus mesophilus]|uniref:nucleotide exchange factor GrpE n=1 Tax=Methylococcus mesophilus TaxID=2993564 RepID=UPI00224B0622|nr:nucleotide exchange factor GrpE [Methylococcus mesophilus]UZR29964.1 nucleotide exchange factor GrpE [Methylococcus mesophilus]